MKKNLIISYLTVLACVFCTVINAQEHNETSRIKNDINGIMEALKTNNSEVLYTYLPNEKTLKEIFLLSEDGNFENIKKRYGYHINISKSDFLNTILKKVSSSFKSYEIIFSHYLKPTQIEFSKTIISTLIKIDSNCYELELFMLKLNNNYYYLPKEELQGTKESCSELFTKVKNRKSNDNEVLVLYDSNANDNSSKPVPFALTDVKPSIGKCELKNTTICFRTAIERIISEGLLKSNDETHTKPKRFFISFTISKEGQIQNIAINNTDTELKKNISDILLKIDNIVPAQKNGTSVTSLFTSPITINIK